MSANSELMTAAPAVERCASPTSTQTAHSMYSVPDPISVVFSTKRVLTYSPAAVYAAFAEADRLARWWGPRGFTNSVELFEFRAGGRWKFVMHGPDGGHHQNASVFRELVVGSRVVIEHVSPPQFTLTVTLAAERI